MTMCLLKAVFDRMDKQIERMTEYIEKTTKKLWWDDLFVLFHEISTLSSIVSQRHAVRERVTGRFARASECQRGVLFVLIYDDPISCDASERQLCLNVLLEDELRVDKVLGYDERMSRATIFILFHHPIFVFTLPRFLVVRGNLRYVMPVEWLSYGRDNMICDTCIHRTVATHIILL